MRQRFHKHLLPIPFRTARAAEWASNWKRVRVLETPPEFCARVIADTYRDFFGDHWSNGPRVCNPSPPTPALALLAKNRVRRLPDSSIQALIRWSRGDIHLRLFDRVPLPLEVLQAQAQGCRCVSALTTEDEIRNFEIDGRDFLTFLIHDLEHAQHLTADPVAFTCQIKFAQWILRLWPEVRPCLYGQALAEFEYLASDMNSHIVHLLKTLKSWSQRHGIDLSHFPESLKEDWKSLNTAEEDRARVFKNWTAGNGLLDLGTRNSHQSGF